LKRNAINGRFQGWSFAAGLIVLATAAVILAVWAMPVSPAITHDSATFINAAQHLLRDGHYAIDMSFPSIPQAVRPVCAFVPGFPVLLSALFRLGLSESTVIYGLALVMFPTMVILVSLLTRYLSGSTAWALVAGAWALFPPLLNLMTYTLTEAIFIPLSLVIFLVTAIYLSRAKPNYGLLILISFLLAIASFVRPVSFVVLGAVGAVVVLRAFVKRKFIRGAFEGSVVGVSLLPLGLYQFSNRYCATGGAGLTFEHTTPAWLLQLLVRQWVPDISLGLGFRTLSGQYAKGAILVAIGLVVLAALGWVIWHYRSEVKSIGRDLMGWSVLLIAAYVGLFFVAIFGVGSAWAKFDFPRMFIPVFPAMIILIVVLLSSIFKNLKLIWIRGVILLGVALLGIGYFQAGQNFYAQIPMGRGIEAPEIRNSPVFPYLKQTLKPEDIVYTTEDPTLWYYLRRPVRRVDNIHTLRCESFVKPQAGGRMVFVLFQFINYPDDPRSPAEINWFKQWVSACGTVDENQVLGAAAIYIVTPGG
jgi:hypothetical protein